MGLIWLAGGLFGYFTADMPKPVCLGTISHLQAGYKYFSEYKPAPAVSQPKEPSEGLGHIIHGLEGAIAELMAKEGERPSHAAAIIVISAALFLTYPAGLIIRYAVEAHDCTGDDKSCPTGPFRHLGSYVC